MSTASLQRCRLLHSAVIEIRSTCSCTVSRWLTTGMKNMCRSNKSMAQSGPGATLLQVVTCELKTHQIGSFISKQGAEDKENGYTPGREVVCLSTMHVQKKATVAGGRLDRVILYPTEHMLGRAAKQRG